MKIMQIYINQQLVINNQRCYQKKHISNLSNPVNSPVNRDDFTYITKNLYKQKIDLSFGSIPEKEMYKACDDLLDQIGPISDPEQIKTITRKFLFTTLDEVLTGDGSKSEFFHSLRHTLKNLVGPVETYVCLIPQKNLLKDFPKVESKEGYVNFQKEELNEFVQNIKELTTDWRTLENWSENTNQKVPVNKVFELLKKLHKKYTKRFNLSIDRNELIDGKQVENPFQIYKLLEHPYLNAVKYGGDKPFKIIIEEVDNGNNKAYYTSFINPETTPIPNVEIDRILEGTGYRAIETKNINGSGTGFTEITEILRKNGYENEIPNLIQKDREKGVCVRVPIIGIC